jgi:hypothetical protein
MRRSAPLPPATPSSLPQTPLNLLCATLATCTQSHQSPICEQLAYQQLLVFMPLQSTTESTTARTWIIAVSACALVAWVLFLLRPDPATGAPYGSITLLGYTTNSAGTRVAMFRVTNPSNIVVVRHSLCIIHVKPLGHNWTPHSELALSNLPRRSLLLPNTSEVIEVPTPDTQSPWRASLYFSNDAGPAWPVKWFVNVASHSLGLPKPYDITTCLIHSAEIENHN